MQHSNGQTEDTNHLRFITVNIKLLTETHSCGLLAISLNASFFQVAR